MDFAPTTEQRDLQATARRYLAGRYPPDRIAVLAGSPAGDAGTSWPELIRMGWLDDDLGPAELALLAEESGYALHPVPWWSTMGAAAPLYRAAGRPLPDRPVTLARAGTSVTVAGGTLTGHAGLVPDAATAATILVTVPTPDGPAVYAADRGAPGLTVTERPGLDRLRPSAEVRLTGVPARLLVPPEAATAALAAAASRTTTLLAAEAVGVAQRALDLARDHAGLRHQFGRPIGSFQAVAHRLADSYVAVELARSLAYRAAVDTDEPEEAVAAAAVAAPRAAVQACEDAMQVIGGLAATWEYPLHWWYRRALWLDAYDSGPRRHLAVLAGRLLDG